MLVFIDESGDAGLKIESGSSSHFIVTLVMFENFEDAEKADEHFSEMRDRLKLHNQFEFHFNKLSQKLREHFLKEIDQFNFKYFSFVIYKKDIDESWVKSGNEFYKFAYTKACLIAKDYLENATIIVDGQSSKDFKQELEKHLKSALNDEVKKRMKKLKMQDSQKNNLIQLADMICGAVVWLYRKDEKKTDSYRKIVELHEEKVEIYAKK